MVGAEKDVTKGQDNWLSNAHKIIDSNIRLIKNGLYVVCGVGIIIIGRSLYVTRVFKSAQEIPTRFLQNQVSLLGEAREVTEDGIIEIQHIPPMRIPFSKHQGGNLQVKLACLDISPAGKLWLSKNVVDKTVWFRLLHRNASLIHCSVIIPQIPRNIHVNEELMRQGLCKLSSTENLQKEYQTVIQTNKTFLKYLDRMVFLEGRAFKKETGMWKINEPLEKTWRTKSVDAIKSVLSSPFRAVLWMYKKVRRRKENS